MSKTQLHLKETLINDNKIKKISKTMKIYQLHDDIRELLLRRSSMQ